MKYERNRELPNNAEFKQSEDVCTYNTSDSSQAQPFSDEPKPGKSKVPASKRNYGKIAQYEFWCIESIWLLLLLVASDLYLYACTMPDPFGRRYCFSMNRPECNRILYLRILRKQPKYLFYIYLTPDN